MKMITDTMRKIINERYSYFNAAFLNLVGLLEFMSKKEQKRILTLS